MGRKEELVYEVLGLPFPRAYYEALGWEDPNRKAWDADQLLNAITPGRSEAPGYVSPLDRALYWGDGAYVGDVKPKDIAPAIVRVMDEYVNLVQDALSIPGLSESDFEKIRKRGFARYSEFVEWFSSNKYLIEKHYGESESTRAHIIANYEPTVQSYFSLLKKTNLAITAFFLKKLAVIIPEDERRKHTYICAKTGSGKSELIKMLAYSYIKKPDYCTTVILEPHSDLCEEIAKFKENGAEILGRYRSKKLIYIAPALYDDFSPSINPFELKEKTEKNIDLMSQEITRVFEELLKESGLTQQMKTVLVPCICVLLRMENATIKDLQTFMDDDKNSALVNLGKQSPDEEHSGFFKNRFHNTAYVSTKQSIYTKIQNLLNSPGFRYFICRPSTFDLKQALDGKNLIIFNLVKGDMGGESAEAAGRFVVAMIQGIIRRRSEIEKKDRVPVHMFIDECQNYVSSSVEEILTELRKYGLHLTLANQFIGQDMSAQFKTALLSSTNIKFIGINSVSSLSVFQKETGVDIQDFQNLDTGEFFLKCGKSNAFKMSVPSFLADHANSMTRKQWEEILYEQKNKLLQTQKNTKREPIARRNTSRKAKNASDRIECKQA